MKTFKEFVTEAEDEVVVAYYDKNGKYVSEKSFSNLAAAQSYVDRGNKVDAVGGKYKIIRGGKKD